MKAAALLPRVRALIAAPASDAELLDRFVQARDQDAFAALVRRHGPLVLATARRVVGNPADADDVFQATFLLLARNAAGIRDRAAVAGWLHGVASRMARTARRTAARRPTYEARAQSSSRSNQSELSWREVQQVFEEELTRLPDLYRVPFVACTLNGEPRADVARQLRVKEGTISSRLAEAKRRLQEGLSARGVSLAAFLGAVSLPALAVSRDLVQRTVRTAATGPVPASVSALLHGGLMIGKKTLVATALVLAIGLAMTALGRPGDAVGSSPQPPAAKDTAPAAKEPAKAAPITVRGKVLDADGKPLADVPIRLWSSRNGDKLPDPTTTTDATGAFQFKPGQQDVADNAVVLICPPGLPAEWAPLSRFKDEVTVKLPKDDVPFTGTIVSLENQPIKDVTVEVVRVGTAADGKLTEWVDKNVAMRKDRYWMNETGLITLSGKLVLQTTKATTDSGGKFKLMGFGRDRILTVKVHGPNVESKYFWVVARPGGPADGYIKTPDFNHGLYPPEVTVRLAPSRPLVGTVRDSKSGKPVPGVIVREESQHRTSSITDQEGRYRLEGVPKKETYSFSVAPRKGVPYFDHTAEGISDTAGFEPLETDMTITRGLELTGRIVDKAGRPVRAQVFYHPSPKNTNATDTSLGRIHTEGGRTTADGTFYLTVWPGRGIIDVRANDRDKFASVEVRTILKEEGALWGPIGPVHVMTVIEVDAGKPETLNMTFTLGEAVVRKGTVVGPDGKPLDGVTAAGVRGLHERPGPLKSNEFEVAGMRTTSQRLLVFVHDGKKVGAVETVSGDSTDPVQVKLQPLGTITGEVRKDNKAPWANLTVTALPQLRDGRNFDVPRLEQSKIQGIYDIKATPWWELTKRTVKTDEKGQFRLEGLLPGLDYTVYVSEGDLGEPDTLVTSRPKVTVDSGKTTDLGVLTKSEPAKE
jgi:RNA polymerase sigma factor (sigma-70 family)